LMFSKKKSEWSSCGGMASSILRKRGGEFSHNREHSKGRKGEKKKEKGRSFTVGSTSVEDWRNWVGEKAITGMPGGMEYVNHRQHNKKNQFSKPGHRGGGKKRRKRGSYQMTSGKRENVETQTGRPAWRRVMSRCRRNIGGGGN